MKKLIIASLALLVSVPAFAAETSTAKGTDTLIVPNNHVGPVTKDMTEDKLKALVGEKNLRRVLLLKYKTGYRCATELYPNSPKSMIVLWNSNKDFYTSTDKDSGDSKKCAEATDLSEPNTVIIGEYDVFIDGALQSAVAKGASPWHTASGLRFGETMVKLEKQNGAAVTFSNYQDDDSTVVSWGEGRLADGVAITVTYSDVVQKDLAAADADKSDLIDSSKVPAKTKAAITVATIAITLNP